MFTTALLSSRATNDLNDLLCNLRLAGTVHGERQRIVHFVGVVGRRTPTYFGSKLLNISSGDCS